MCDFNTLRTLDPVVLREILYFYATMNLSSPADYMYIETSIVVRYIWLTLKETTKFIHLTSDPFLIKIKFKNDTHVLFVVQ